MSYFIMQRSYASAALALIIQSVSDTRRLSLIQRTYWRYFYTRWKGSPSFLMPNISTKFQSR